MDRIKRLSTEILSEYKDSFGIDFSENKKMLNEITIVRSKGLKNEIAGYITKILLREHKFQTRKQKLIDDEKKFLERNDSQEKKSTPKLSLYCDKISVESRFILSTKTELSRFFIYVPF